MNKQNTSSNDLLVETKTQIRCIIVSNPANMTVGSLVKDYMEMIGNPLPHLRLGFRRPIDLLHSIPDVVQVSGEHPEMAILTPVITKNLTNLNKLITKQRIEKSRRGQRKERRRTKVISVDQYSQNDLNKKHRHSNDSEMTGKCFNRRNLNKSEVRWISNQDSYRTRTSQKLVTVEEWWNPETTDSKLVEPNLIKDKIAESKLVKTNQQSSNAPNCTNDPIIESKSVNSNVISDKITESKFVKPKLVTHKITESKFVKSNTPNCIRDQIIESKYVKSNIISDKIVESKFVESSCDKTTVPNFVRSDSPNYSSDKITESKFVGSNGISGKITEKSVNSNVINDKITESKFVKSNSSNHTSDQITGSKSEEPNSPNLINDKDINDKIVEPDEPNLISDKIRIHIGNLMQHYPEGLLINSLGHYYQESFGEELNYEKLGFTSALHFCLQLTDKFEIEYSDQLQAYYLFDPTQKKRPYNENDIKLKQIESETLIQKSNLNIPQSLLANDVICKNDEILPITYKVKFNEGMKLKILITEIYEPTRFWFVVYHEDVFPTLEKISKEMSVLYNETRDKYIIPAEDIQPGIFCAACINDNWNRAYVMGSIDSSEVKVFFIDYGNIAVINNSCIRYMIKNYQDFPRQAVRGRLDYISSKDRKSWDPCITRYFFNIVVEKLLLAHITRTNRLVDAMETWMVLKLYNKEPNSDLTINEKLLCKGYAAPGPTFSTEKLRNAFKYSFKIM